jgi:ATP-dependent helicase YprA (DUF1998 family)
VRVSGLTGQFREYRCRIPPYVLTLSQRQQIGRAGRRARDSLAVYVADGTDIHYVNYPDDLFDKPTSDLVVNLENSLVIEAHLQCAAFEMPLSAGDVQWFGPLTTTLCETKLVRDQEGWCVNRLRLRRGCDEFSGSTHTRGTCLTPPVLSPFEGLMRRNIR